MKRLFEWKKWKRWFKYRYNMLLRAKGGPAFVALGFSIGLAIEMFTLPTAGLAFFLIFPLVYLFRASLAGALVGFVFGKFIFIPLAFLNKMVGNWFVPKSFYGSMTFLPDFIEKLVYVNMKLIVGGIVDGILLGMLFYWPVRRMLEMYQERRKAKRRLRQIQIQKLIEELNN